MSGRIPEAFIEELLDRIDIVDVIQRRVPLKPAGREFHACCPFHEEKTPSFTVSPQKQFYHCFGCGAHGTAIGFLMQFEGLEFVDVVEDLAHSAGMPIPQRQQSKPPSPSYTPLSKACDFFQQQLQQAPAARRYLQQRGVNQAMIEQFQIGYASPANDALGRHLRQQQFSPAVLEQAGLINGQRDRFRDRIMFPIHDRRGRVIAFGGRALGDLGPKYLNSPETDVFHKGRELYGLFQARQRSRPQRLVVVEGYMDVVALTQAGLDGAVATLGTATTAIQVERLFQTSSDVVFCFDGDNAGRKAAWRALESALPQLRAGRQVSFLLLPEGEDPDTLIRARGLDDFLQRLDQASPLSEYFFQHLGEGIRLDSVDGRAQLVALAQPYLEKMPAGVFRDLMAQELETRTRHHGMQLPVAERPTRSRKVTMTPVRRAVALIVQDPALGEQLTPPDLSDCQPPQGFELLLQLIDFCRQRPQITTAQLLERWRGREHGKALEILATQAVSDDAEIRRQELMDTLRAIEISALTDQIRSLEKRQASGTYQATDAEVVRNLLRRKTALQQIST
ncbi:MAG: DNA primase [Wenzhouxiangellaceae bacterium]